jgi:energy-converting hydrogenase Eha subunit G
MQEWTAWITGALILALLANIWFGSTTLILAGCLICVVVAYNFSLVTVVALLAADV